ncbi:MAG: hypothetical protein ALAOOOJD_04719 [bacterium]|nr:hypothetical protein [bacterium]
MLADELAQSILTELIAVFVHRLGNAVGIKNEHIAALNRDGPLFDGRGKDRAFFHADCQAARIQQLRRAADAFTHDQRIVAGAGENEGVVVHIKKAINQADKNFLRRVFIKDGVHVAQQRLGRRVNARQRFDDALRHRHEKRGGDAFAGNVANHHAEA